jgi:iron complex outermembrane receptor protein
MMYFTFAQGYEPGGFNLANFEGESSLFGFGPEEATSYEIGWKGRLAGGRVSASIAAFYIDYQDRQIEVQAESEAGTVIEGIVNLGDSKQHGVEAELVWQATDALTWMAAVGWVDAEWKSGASAQGVDLEGETPPNINDWGWNLSADWRQPVGDQGLMLIVGAQVNYSGEYEGLQAWNPVTNPDYTVVNAQVGIGGPSWEFTINAKNLFDEDYYVDLQRFPNLHLLDGGEEILIGTRGQPRLITGSFTYFF